MARLNFRYGPRWAGLLADAIFRGTVGTPPPVLYFTMGATNAFTVIDELSGITRWKQPLSRGFVSGIDAWNYWHQSSGTVMGSGYTQQGIELCIPDGHAPITGEKLLCYDAAAGGNLLFATTQGGAAVKVSGDVVRYGVNSMATPPQPGTIIACDSVNYGSIYMTAIIHDWLLRGYDSVNQYFNPATYTNVYLQLYLYTAGQAAACSRVAVARSPAQWSAATAVNADAIPKYKVSNLNAIVFGPLTTGFTNQYLGVKVWMSNTPQAFSDLIMYAWISSGTLYTAAAGDTITFPAGTLELEL